MDASQHAGKRPILNGYTLIELMMGLALIAILLGWGVPNLISLYHRNLLAAQSERLLNDLNHARSESIKRNIPVVICRSANSQDCASGGSARSDWGAGWISFVNRDRDKYRDADEQILRVGEPVPREISLYFNHWWRLTFLPSGRAGNGTFTLCDANSNQHKIIVYLSGRTRRISRNAAAEGCPES